MELMLIVEKSKKEAEQLKNVNIRFYPSTLKELDNLVKEDRNFTSRADFVRSLVEHIITHGIAESSGDIDTESIIKEILKHLADRIQNHEDRMYQRVAKLEKMLSEITIDIDRRDPQKAEVRNYLSLISQQLFIEKFDQTIKINIPERLIKLLEYSWYADYLSTWIDQQQTLNTIEYDGRVIIWNVDRIKEVYHHE